MKPATLYAYVSRGLLRSVAVPGTRAKRYLRADVERLRARSGARSGHAPAAAGALRWGAPVIDTSISAISAEGPLYRGRAAVDLAAEADPVRGRRPRRCGPATWATAPRWPTADLGIAPEALGAVAPGGRAAAGRSRRRRAAALGRARSRRGSARPPGADLARARLLVRRMAAMTCLTQAPERCAHAAAAPDVAASMAVALGDGSDEAAAPSRRPSCCPPTTN